MTIKALLVGVFASKFKIYSAAVQKLAALPILQVPFR